MHKSWKKILSTLLIFNLFLSFVLVGCGTKENAQQQDDKSKNITGDIRETTASVTVLPSFLDNVDSSIKQVYTAVGENYQVVENMACYCGCGQSVGHKSNRDCFIKEVKANGQITWDSHATTCLNCLQIAAESIAMKKEGKSLLEIRKYIDNKYKEGYAKPTPTPMPAA
jgi:hypothetical protein